MAKDMNIKISNKKKNEAGTKLMVNIPFNYPMVASKEWFTVLMVIPDLSLM